MKRLFTLFSICLLFILPLVLTSCAENPVGSDKAASAFKPKENQNTYALFGSVNELLDTGIPVEEGVVYLQEIGTGETQTLPIRAGGYFKPADGTLPEGDYILQAESKGVKSKAKLCMLRSDITDIILYIDLPSDPAVPPAKSYNIKGKLLDSENNYIKGMKLAIKSGNYKKETATSIINGDFLIESLPPGDYEIEVKDDSLGYDAGSPYRLQISSENKAMLQGRQLNAVGTPLTFNLGNLVFSKKILPGGSLEGVILGLDGQPLPQGTPVVPYHVRKAGDKHEQPTPIWSSVDVQENGFLSVSKIPPGEVLIAREGATPKSEIVGDQKEYFFDAGDVYVGWHTVQAGYTTHFPTVNIQP
ncbi:MAG: hypothetical protein GX221_02325 [Candidatus Riflebacteria bacterium]|nr:hypothetical protein [Candidatus Riflebacteria bacterium]